MKPITQKQKKLSDSFSNLKMSHSVSVSCHFDDHYVIDSLELVINFDVPLINSRQCWKVSLWFLLPSPVSIAGLDLDWFDYMKAETASFVVILYDSRFRK